MDASIRQLIRDASKFPHSAIGKEFSFEDAVIIWKSVGYFVRDQLRKGKSVIIPGIGRITVIEVRIPLAHNPPRFLCRKEPVFRASSRLPVRNCLKETGTRLQPDSHPETRLCPAWMSGLVRHRHEDVKTLLQEVTSHVHKCLAGKKGKAILPLQSIGTVLFETEKVRVMFEKTLLREIQEQDIVKEFC